MNNSNWQGGCWAEAYCKGYPNKCGFDCIGWVQLKNIYALSHMPAKYQKGVALNLTDDEAGRKDREAYIYLKDWAANVQQNVADGKGLYIVSKNKGNGKTAWACKIMNEYFKAVALKNDLRCRGIFINVPTFLEELRSLMNEKDESDRERIEAKIDSVM